MVTLGWLSFLWLVRAEIGLNQEFGWATLFCIWGLPKWLSGEESACSAGDTDLIPGSERSSGKGHGKPLQYSCLENPMNRGVWWATIHGVTKELDMTEQLNNNNNNLLEQKQNARMTDGEAGGCQQLCVCVWVRERERESEREIW